MRRVLSIACLAAGLIAAAAPAGAATIVNVDGRANASLDGTNAKTFALQAGRYRISFVKDAFTAFSRFSGSGGCDAGGANCVQGFENSARIVIDGVTTLLGDGNASGGLGPVSGGGYFDTAANSFANSSRYSAIVNVAARTTGSAYLYDDFLDDNRGGVSLSIAGVPEPATWAMMIGGIGLVGGQLRRRRSGVAVRFA